jgi:hypothetical protein
VLAAAGDLAIEVLNAADLSAAAGPFGIAAIALEATVLVEGGATLAGAAEVGATGAALISATVLDRAAGVSSGAAATGYGRAVPGGAVGDAGPDAPDARWSDADATAAVDAITSLALGLHEDRSGAERNAAPAPWRLPDARETGAEPSPARIGNRLEEVIARELGPALADAAPEAAPSGAGILLASHRLGTAVPGAGSGAGDEDGRGRAAAERGGDETGEEGDTGLGASLVLSVLKDSTLAELARSVATGGGSAVLSAGTAPFARARVRGGGEGEEQAPGGALELRDGDLADAVVVTEALLPAGGAGEHADLAAELADALRLASAADLALATAARHELVAEGGGGAEPGTAVTPAVPIDVAASVDDAAMTGDTFSLAGPADAGVGGPAPATDLPPLEFEMLVGAPGLLDAPIRSDDGVEAFAGERAIGAGGLLDRAVRVPAGAPGSGSADVSMDASREVVLAYVGALASPIAASAGLTRNGRRWDRLPGAVRYASLTATARRDAFRGGGGWADAFVNELGVAPDDQQPNAKIKTKL